MKLGQDPTTRARLRLLQPWLTPAQFCAVRRALEEIEVRPAPSLASRFMAAWRAARIAWLAAWSSGSAARCER